MSEPRSMPRGVRLSEDDRAVFLRLCEGDGTAVQVIAEMQSWTGITMSMTAVYKTRQAMGRKRKKATPAPRPKATRKPCTKCQDGEGTLPGEPWAVKGPICLTCQKAIRRQHEEDDWHRAQAARRGIRLGA